MDYTLVYGTIYGPDGLPYKGAIVKFSLSNAFSQKGRYFHTSEVRAVTNKFGIFEVDLPPSTWDVTGENYYRMTVVLNNVTTENVIVPVSMDPVNFSTLEHYKFPYERQDMIGAGCC